MDFKIEYIASLFQKTSYKKYENYCITRLWHRLNNNDIKIIPQQYVNRHEDMYALTDIYFPQFKIHIEVNEPAHYESEEKIINDNRRKLEIEERTGHKLYVIDCRKDLSEIDKNIDEIIYEINIELKKQKEERKFKPWEPKIEKNPLYWKAKKIISTDDDISMDSIEDICSLFEADFKKIKRGFLRKGEIQYPKDSNYYLWWPSEKSRSGWINKFNINDSSINETHRDSIKITKNYDSLINDSKKRIVFLQNKDILGLESYKFKGVYIVDNEKSNSKDGIIWKLIDNKINL